MVTPNKILVENKSILTVLVDGKMDTVPNTAYNKMKIGDYGGKRIFYPFGEDKRVEETFDNGIFNCYVGKEEPIQLRNGEQVANAITEHKEKGTITILKRIYLAEKEESYSAIAIDEFLEPFTKSGRVKKINKGYLIDKRFLVTEHAQAQQYKNKAWNNVCIVVTNDIVPFEIDTPFGKTEITVKTVEILSKIIFLLKPNTGDSVFMDQLTPKIRTQLKRDFPPPPPDCERESEWQKDDDGFSAQCTGQMDTYNSVTGLKVCNVCKRSSVKDTEKWKKEQLALETVDKVKEEDPLQNYIDEFIGSGHDGKDSNS